MRQAPGTPDELFLAHRNTPMRVVLVCPALGLLSWHWATRHRRWQALKEGSLLAKRLQHSTLDAAVHRFRLKVSSLHLEN